MTDALLLFSRIIACGVLVYAGVTMLLAAWVIATQPGTYWRGAGSHVGFYVVAIFVSAAWLYASWGVQ